MSLLTPELHAVLRANAHTHHHAMQAGAREPDPAPVVKFFNPVGAATWLATELDADGDTLFGLADLGFGCPELGSFSAREIAQVRLPLGLLIERDLYFSSAVPLAVWAEIARAHGSISAAKTILCRAASHGDPLPKPPSEGGGG
jgi:plasmid stability protein